MLLPADKFGKEKLNQLCHLRVVKFGLQIITELVESNENK
jgi:hypothetical protein